MTVEAKSYIKRDVNVLTKDGVLQVPGIVHPNADGLAVTMVAFGLFEVTHTASGMRMSGRHERMCTALFVLSRFAQIARGFEFSWDDIDQDSVAKKITEIGQMPVPFCGDDSDHSVQSWLASIRIHCFEGMFGEYPEERDLLSEALEILNNLKHQSARPEVVTEA